MSWNWVAMLDKVMQLYNNILLEGIFAEMV